MSVGVPRREGKGGRGKGDGTGRRFFATFAVFFLLQCFFNPVRPLAFFFIARGLISLAGCTLTFSVSVSTGCWG